MNFLQIKRRKHFLLPSLFSLLCVVYGNQAKMLFFDLIKTADSLGYSSHSLIVLNVVLSLIAFPIIGHLSDVWCRKKILLFSILIITIGTIFLYLGWFFLSIICFSLSPVISVSQAAYCDVHFTNERTPNIVDTFIVQSFPWIFAPLFFSRQNQFFYSTVIIGVLYVIFGFFFRDRIDREHIRSKLSIIENVRNLNFKKLFKNLGVLEVLEKYGIQTCLAIIIAFTISDFAWSILFFRLEDSPSTIEISKYFALAPGIAFLCGALFVRFIIRRKKIFSQKIDDDAKSILVSDGYFKLLIYITIGCVPFFVFIVFVNWILNSYNSNIIVDTLPGFTFLGGMFIPAIYAFFGSRIGFHSLGMVYATIEVLQSVVEYFGVQAEGTSVLQPPIILALTVLALTFLSFFIINSLTFGKRTQNK